MHDALARYEPDTIVVDVEDERPSASSRPSYRERLEELTMQVLHGGAWHRRTPDLASTACGETIHSQFTPVRSEELTHPLSSKCGCFTAFELSRADEAKKAEESER